MKKRTLGKTGFEVSEIGLGCWQLGNDFGPVEDSEAKAILDSAAEQGINLFDTADVYGGGVSEQRIGDWLKTQKAKPVVITKVGRGGDLFPDGYNKNSVRKSLEGSKARLGVESLDLVQLHCIPPEMLKTGEIFSWMEAFQQEGLITHYGASVETIEDALVCCQSNSLATLQIIFNIFRQDAVEKLLPIAEQKNIGIIARLPLASGILSGRMQKNRTFSAQDHRNYNRDGAAFNVGETFNGLPFELGVDLADQVKTMLPSDMNLLQCSLRWLLDQPQVSTVISGASSSQQVISNALTSDLPPLSQALSAKLQTFYQEQVRQHIRGEI
ncbi:aldo/keto reductase [Psychrosphaera sp. B3R10]|uniref:aldo/keto reductase n=1 Tax=unclassified Psychrosphaera TaxID=2641570 RepID=UPI001C091B4F|nr:MULTISPECIES: aldo/keto reductase [unclassified Psychrosphaera]MBU2883970.1 aldo/keto reductase [Psychrosphaera sp. I2R16]MBU2990375.1 aldo/keto reductase [Psychrosphaera sp. B3R10]